MSLSGKITELAFQLEFSIIKKLKYKLFWTDIIYFRNCTFVDIQNK